MEEIPNAVADALVTLLARVEDTTRVLASGTAERARGAAAASDRRALIYGSGFLAWFLCFCSLFLSECR